MVQGAFDCSVSGSVSGGSDVPSVRRSFWGEEPAGFIRASEVMRRAGSDTAHVSPLARHVALSFAVILGAWALGALLCLMKGEGGGLAMAVGNLSAPYVIVAVFAGLTTRRWWVGSLLGILATEATVAGFYGAWAVYFGHEVSRTSVMLWGGAGIFSGALFGVLGSVARAHPGLRYVLPALLLLEPGATVAAAPLLARFGIGYGWGVLDLPSLGAYSLEVVLGVVVFVLVRRHVRTRRRTGGALASP